MEQYLISLKYWPIYCTIWTDPNCIWGLAILTDSFFSVDNISAGLWLNKGVSQMQASLAALRVKQYLKECWVIACWTIRNKFELNFIENADILKQKKINLNMLSTKCKLSIVY